MQSLSTVGVIEGEDADDYLPILSALAQSCGLNLRRAYPDEGSRLAGFILLGNSSKVMADRALKERPSLRVISSDTPKPAATVRFGADYNSPTPFRGRSVETGSAVPGTPPDGFGDVIATADGKPVWMTKSEGGVRHDTCWVSRPWLKRGECVFDHLNGDRLMNLLPLLEWLRWISDYREWKQPALRACFMFDDPNLHATRYGFVRFDHLAEEGMRHHYHTSFATIPLDGYYVNQEAARIIRENHETLSLLIHGNNHTYRELAGRESPVEQLSSMRQAILRIIAVERKSGVTVSRVMAPPHGVCSADMMAAMTTVGLEAVCVSHGSVWTGNPGADWAVALGSLPATLIAGLLVIPRFRLDRNPENNILLAAYLNQPIIPVGHHWDLADGTDILSSAADFINGLAQVSWNDMSSIARSNYRCRVQGHVMRIQTFSRITAVNVPEGVSELELEASWMDPGREHVEYRSSGNGDRSPIQALPSGLFRLCVTPGSRVELVVTRTHANGEQ
ncbi:MAG TPA: hypothetical protein VIW47_02930, partial [Nitrospiraceae bacterium]